MGNKLAAYDASRTVIGFYDEFDSPPPEGVKCIEITNEQWEMLKACPTSGKRPAFDDEGNPIAADPLPPSRSEVAATMRTARDAALSSTDWLVARHQDQKVMGDGTTLSAVQFAALIKYRQELRDIADADGWPYITLPAAPNFLSGGV